MAIRRWSRRAARGAPVIHARVDVGGNVSGQLAVGHHIVQTRVDHVNGPVVLLMKPGETPTATLRAAPVRLLPRRPTPMLDRHDETAAVTGALAAGQAVDVHGPAGMGKSTLLRQAAHGVDGSVVHLSAQGMSRGDLLQALFDAFYATDVPVHPTPGQLRHYLQPVRATVLIDDVDLPDDAVADIADHIPGCGLALTGARPPGAGEVRPLPLAGLPVDAAAQLLLRALGRPDDPAEERAVAELVTLAGGTPGRLVQFGAAAAASGRSLTAFAAAAATAGPPPLLPASPGEAKVLGLLAALPGLALDTDQLIAISGVGDVQRRLLDWLSRGVVTASDPGARPGPRTYRLASGVELDRQAWGLDERRAEVSAWFTAWAVAHPGAAPSAGGAEPLRIVAADARGRRHWRTVIALGAVLNVAFAASGRWDAWHASAQASLEAARALGDRAAEGMALHQLGTEALCRGDLTRAREQLSGALSIRTALGDRAGAHATQQNLDVIGTPPIPAEGHHDAAAGGGGHRALLATVPTGVWAAGVALPLVGALTLLGTTPAGAGATIRLEPEALPFAAQTEHATSGPRTVHLRNIGQSSAHVDGVAVTGRDPAEFTVLDTTCGGEVPPGGGCDTTVTFTPTAAGPRQADLTWRVGELAADPVSRLSGTGVDAAPTTVDVVPAGLAFDDQAVSTLGPPRTVGITAPAPLDLGTASVDGVDAAEFVLRDGCAGFALRPGGRCEVGVRFAPGRVGPRGAVLTLRDTGGRAVAAVPLSGNGTDAAGAVAVAPASIAFGPQPVGTSAPVRTVTVTARGSPLDLAGVTVAGDPAFAAVSDDCPTRLAPGSSCSVGVAFTPTRAGPQTAALLVAAPGRPTVPLRGVGTAPRAVLPAMTPSAIAFGDHPVGTTSADQPVTITNRAATALQLGAPAVEGTGFAVAATTCAGAPLPPAASCEVRVRFAPRVAGAQAGVLAVTVAGVAGRAAVRLSGTGTDARTVTVPDVVGQTLAAARAALEKVGLRVGTVTRAPAPGRPGNTVTDQDPFAARTADRGSAVDLTVSPDTVTVPDVRGLPEATAGARLDAAGLRPGTVERVPDRKAPLGTVISTTPGPGGQAERGSPVSLVVSSGPPPVLVPSCTGDEKAVTAALGRAGLRSGKITRQPDLEIPLGGVVRCNPATGTSVPNGSAVDLVVSTGPPPVPVPPCIGDERSVLAALDAVGLHVSSRTDRPDRTPAGSVIGCTPPTGTKLPPGSGVVLITSSGPGVPACVGRTEAAVVADLDQAGLRVGAVTRPPDKSAAGTVLSCRPATGTAVKPGSTVDLVVSAGPRVPSCAGDESTVRGAIGTAGLRVGAVTRPPDRSAAGTVLSCRPATGTAVKPGSAVDLVVSAGPRVPECAGRSYGAVAEDLAGLGLRVSDTVDRPDKAPARTVLECRPATGSPVEPGGGVVVVLSSGPVVPECAGDEKAVRAALKTMGLTVDRVVRQRDEAPAGTVLGCQPTTGTPVAADSGVVVVESAGMPDCTGPEATVTAAVKKAGLDPLSTSESSETVRSGDVIRCESDPQAPIERRSEVTVVVSTGSLGTVRSGG